MMDLEFVWPIEEDWNHNYASEAVQSTEHIENWHDFTNAINSITWDEIFEIHERYYAQTSKSLSKAINHVINNRLMRIADFKSPIFDDDKFGKAPYIIEYKLGSLAIDTGFGHYNTLVWKLSRLNLAICDNQLQKSSKQSIGILIVVEESLKKAGNFDNGVGTFEQAVEYVQAFNKQWDAPLLLICLKNPQTFQVVDNGRSAPIRSTITFQ